MKTRTIQQRIVLWIVAAVFAAAMIAMTAVSLMSCVSVPVDDPPLQVLPSITDGNGNDLTEGTHAMPARMTFAPRANDQPVSVNLTATVKPDYATNKLLDWSVAWKNVDADWAADKPVTEFVTLAESGETATVTFLQAFGEQIEVIAASRQNSDIRAVCTVDCVRKLQYTQVSFTASGMSGDLPFDVFNSTSAMSFYPMITAPTGTQPRKPIVTYTTADGTVDDTYSTKIEIRYSRAFANDWWYNPHEPGDTPAGNYVDITNGFLSDHWLYATVLGLRDDQYAKFYSLFSKYTDVMFDIQVTTTGTHASYQAEFGIKIMPELFVVNIGSLELDQSHAVVAV